MAPTSIMSEERLTRLELQVACRVFQCIRDVVAEHGELAHTEAVSRRLGVSITQLEVWLPVDGSCPPYRSFQSVLFLGMTTADLRRLNIAIAGLLRLRRGGAPAELEEKIEAISRNDAQSSAILFDRLERLQTLSPKRVSRCCPIARD